MIVLRQERPFSPLTVELRLFWLLGPRQEPELTNRSATSAKGDSLHSLLSISVQRNQFVQTDFSLVMYKPQPNTTTRSYLFSEDGRNSLRASQKTARGRRRAGGNIGTWKKGGWEYFISFNAVGVTDGYLRMCLQGCEFCVQNLCKLVLRWVRKARMFRGKKKHKEDGAFRDVYSVSPVLDSCIIENPSATWIHNRPLCLSSHFY